MPTNKLPNNKLPKNKLSKISSQTKKEMFNCKGFKLYKCRMPGIVSFTSTKNQKPPVVSTAGKNARVCLQAIIKLSLAAKALCSYCVIFAGGCELCFAQALLELARHGSKKGSC